MEDDKKDENDAREKEHLFELILGIIFVVIVLLLAYFFSTDFLSLLGLFG